MEFEARRGAGARSVEREAHDPASRARRAHPRRSPVRRSGSPRTCRSPMPERETKRAGSVSSSAPDATWRSSVTVSSSSWKLAASSSLRDRRRTPAGRSKRERGESSTPDSSRACSSGVGNPAARSRSGVVGQRARCRRQRERRDARGERSEQACRVHRRQRSCETSPAHPQRTIGMTPSMRRVIASGRPRRPAGWAATRPPSRERRGAPSAQPPARRERALSGGSGSSWSSSSGACRRRRGPSRSRGP